MTQLFIVAAKQILKPEDAHLAESTIIYRSPLLSPQETQENQDLFCGGMNASSCIGLRTNPPTPSFISAQCYVVT